MKKTLFLIILIIITSIFAGPVSGQSLPEPSDDEVNAVAKQLYCPVCENIPLDARIMAVADSYDAMTSNRPSRSFKLTNQEAIEELKRCSGTQFDPVIVDAFIATMKPASRAVKDPWIVRQGRV